MTEPEDFEIQDTSGLTDADWAEINKLRNAYKSGGSKALSLSTAFRRGSPRGTYRRAVADRRRSAAATS